MSNSLLESKILDSAILNIVKEKEPTRRKSQKERGIIDKRCSEFDFEHILSKEVFQFSSPYVSSNGPKSAKLKTSFRLLMRIIHYTVIALLQTKSWVNMQIVFSSYLTIYI